MTAPAITAREVSRMLAERIEALVADILPAAVKVRREMVVGSVAGEKGQSLSIHVGGGSRRGVWRDFSRGEGGDALDLVTAVIAGGDKRAGYRWAKGWLGIDEHDEAALDRARDRARQAEARALVEARREAEQSARSVKRRWLEAQPIAGTPAEAYLRSRGIDLRQLGRAPGALRYHPSLQYGQDGPRLPAMVAAITRLDGTLTALHRTWIKPDGSGKADAGDGVDDAKRVLGRYAGACIPLWKGASPKTLRDVPAGTDVYVSEGIEDGLTVACARPDLRVIAMISLSNLAALELPRQMGALVVLAQRDPEGSPAAAALAKAIAHHRAAGRRVRTVLPPEGVKDLNDLVRGQSTKIAKETPQ